MRKGIIVNLKRFKVLDYVTLNKIFLMLCMLFIAGIAVGSAVFNKNNWLSDTAEMFFNHYISIHTDANFLKKLCVCFLSYLFVLIFYFLSGTSMLGHTLYNGMAGDIVWRSIVIFVLVARA